jgi:hypothetical protein
LLIDCGEKAVNAILQSAQDCIGLAKKPEACPGELNIKGFKVEIGFI